MFRELEKQLLEISLSASPCFFRSISACLVLVPTSADESERPTGPNHLKPLELERRARAYQAEINAKRLTVRYVASPSEASSKLRQLDMRTASLA